MLVKGPQAAGYPTDLCSLCRVAEVITRHFGVEYHTCPCLVHPPGPGGVAAGVPCWLRCHR